MLKRDTISEKNEITRLEFTKEIRNTLDKASTVVITDNKGIITYVNEKFCQVTKYSKKELLGKNMRIIKSGYHPPTFYENLWKTISTGQTWHGDIQNKAKDGSFYWLRTTIVPVFDRNHKIKNYISIRTDITSQVKTAEESIKAQKVASIGELASRMSHDIRNPLSIIRISIDNLKLLYGVDAMQLKQIQKIERSMNRITHQINDVLDFVKEKPMRINKIKVSKIITNVKDSLIIPDTIKLITPKKDLELWCDVGQFVIVINNLVYNAIQAINGTGVITISAKQDRYNTTIQIKDSGPGIAEKDVEQIFEPLFTTKQQGTGLGLASVKSIVNTHGGTISVTGSPTVFTINIPRAISAEKYPEII